MYVCHAFSHGDEKCSFVEKMGKVLVSSSGEMDIPFKSSSSSSIHSALSPFSSLAIITINSRYLCAATLCGLIGLGGIIDSCLCVYLMAAQHD